MSTINEQRDRMRQMMAYKPGDGLNETIAPAKTIEHIAKGADGKYYAIIRENTSFTLQENADESKKTLAEAYQYVGGFQNRGRYTYKSYADAIKDMDQKLFSLNEAYAKDNEKAIIIETTNPDYKERLVVEGTETMRQEIARQRQIMANAALVTEGEFRRGPGVGMGPVGDGKPFGSKSLETNEVGGNNGFPEKPAEEAFNADGTPKGSNDPNKPFTDKVAGSITNTGKKGMEPVRMDEGSADDNLEVIDVDGDEAATLDANGEGATATLDTPEGEATATLDDPEGTTEGSKGDSKGDSKEDAIADIKDQLEDIVKRLNGLESDGKDLYPEEGNGEDDDDDDEGEVSFEITPDEPEDEPSEDEKLQEAMARQLARHPRFQQILREEKAKIAHERQMAMRRRNRRF